MIGIIDYNAGNITSVARALKYLGHPYILSSSPSELIKAEKLIFPGVGDARFAMEALTKTGLSSFIKEAVKKGVWLLGICLGCQIIYESSEENSTPCLSLLPGKVKHLTSLIDASYTSGNRPCIKIPHIGFNDLKYTNFSPLTEKLFYGIDKDSSYYFVHSYYIEPQDPSIIKATTNYCGLTIPAVTMQNKIVAVQFHPEKSGKPGLKLLENFCNFP